MCALPTSCDLPLPRSEPGNLPVKSVRRARSRSEPIGDRAGRSHPSRQLKFFGRGAIEEFKKKKERNNFQHTRRYIESDGGGDRFIVRPTTRGDGGGDDDGR